LSKLFENRMLYVSLLLGVALVVLAGCSAAEPVANVDSQAKKIVTFEGGSVTQGELDEFAEQSGLDSSMSKDDPQYQAAMQQIIPQLVDIEIAKAYARSKT